MCEPLSMVAGTASLLAASLKLSHSLIMLRSRFQRVPETVSTLCNEVQLTSLGLGELESLLRSRPDVLSRNDGVRQHLLQCVEATTVSMAKSFSALDTELGKLRRDVNDEARGISWRLRFMWVESDLMSVMAQVRDQRNSLGYLMQLVQVSKLDDIHRHFQTTSPGFAALRRTATVAKDTRRPVAKPNLPVSPSSESCNPELERILEQDVKFPDLENMDKPAPAPEPATPVRPGPMPTTSRSSDPPPAYGQYPPVEAKTHPQSHPQPSRPSSSFPAEPYTQSPKVPNTLVHHELHYAVANNDLARIHSLLDSGQNPLGLPSNPYGTLPNASKTSLSLAAFLGRDQILKCFFQRGYGWAINECIGRDMPPLHAASYAGHLLTVQLLLANSANPRLRGPGNNTPLFWACCRGHVAVAEALLVSGSADDVDFPNDKGLTPLMVAAQHGHTAVLELLLQNRANIHARNGKEQTALHLSSHAGHLPCVKALLAAGASLNTPTTNGKSPLIFASAAGHFDIADLLAASGALVNIPDAVGKTPLYHASAGGHSKTVEVLLDRLAATEVITKTGDRPLHIACEKGHARVVGSLLAQGARMDVYRAQDGLDAFSVAVWYRRKEVMGPLVLYKVQQDPGAYTLRHALWNAVEWGLDEVVDALVESGAAIDGGDDEGEGGGGQSLLARAVREGKGEVVRLLVEKGADVNAVDRFGASPLHRAARGKYVGIVKMLVDAGALMDGVDGQGRTAGEVAAVYGSREIREFFEKKV